MFAYRIFYQNMNQEIQFTINDQLILDVLLVELRRKAISHSSYKHIKRN